MGIISSKDTRRVSFDNTFALTPALSIQNSIKDDSIVELEDLTAVSWFFSIFYLLREVKVLKASIHNN